jgi:hypothetical protein
VSPIIPFLRATCLLLGIWGVINAAQWFADVRQWSDGRALGWDLQRLRRGPLYNVNFSRSLYNPTGLSVLAGVQLFTSTVLIAMPVSAATIAWLGCFAAATLLLALRAGPDGADKIAMVVATGALLQSFGLSYEEPRLVLAGALWTGGQLTIAYFASGATKLLLEPWRRGDALKAVFSSYMWGHRWTAAIVRQRGTAQLLAWLIMLMELLFPLALIAPFNWLCAILAGFFLFHLAIAAIMGLNHYTWAFLAAYPSVLLVGQWLRSALGLN